MDTVFNPQRQNYTTLGILPTLDITEEKLNEALVNTTLNYMFGLGWLNTVVSAEVQETTNIYSFAVRRNLLIPYFLCLAVSVPFLILATISMSRNGVSAISGGFIQTVMTTTGSRTVERMAAGGCLGGDENVPQDLLDLKIRYGELVEQRDAQGIRRAGFGTEDEVIPLDRSASYGIRRFNEKEQ
jgi:hypothetical protein